MNPINFFRYSGSKVKFVEPINSLIRQTKKSIYCEPFAGSGAIFFNLPKNFDRYIINDKDDRIISIYLAFQKHSFEEYLAVNEFIQDTFGDIRKSKEAYYNFRDWYNANYYRSGKSESGLYLYFLANSCINSLIRFGPNGFNQSWGNRLYLMDKVTFTIIQSRLQNCEILNLDFFELINYLGDSISDTLLFLDPPYIERSFTYKIEQSFYNQFIQFCKDSPATIIYTDVNHIDLDWNKIVIRQNMENTSPNRKENTTNNIEVAFYNFKNKAELF